MLTAADIRAEWDWVASGVDYVRVRTKADWRTEDVYALCIAGAAQLYLMEDTGGFLVVQVKQLPFKPEKTMLIWVAFDKSGHAWDVYDSQIDDLAASLGCSGVEIWSSRPGMERLCERYGYQPYATIYYKEV